MRHRVAHRKLGRKTEHRIATLRNLASSLFLHERIETTLFKAKDLRPFAERIISKARQDTVHSRRVVARHIHDRELVKRLFSDIGPRFMDRPGGYTRILHTAPRRGDAAEMAIVELVVRKEKEVAPAEPAADKKAKSSGLGGLARRLAGKKKEA
jgi:large subunit ribosomal protein L17